MDLDGNGSIDADELGLVLKSFGEAVPPGRLKALIREVGLLVMVVAAVLLLHFHCCCRPECLIDRRQ